jgi:hypothetical protein
MTKEIDIISLADMSTAQAIIQYMARHEKEQGKDPLYILEDPLYYDNLYVCGQPFTVEEARAEWEIVQPKERLDEVLSPRYDKSPRGC